MKARLRGARTWLHHGRHFHMGEPSLETETDFTGPVPNPVDGERPEAHGNITLHQQCKCGATRQVNLNQQFAEIGTWAEPKAKTRGECG